MVFACVIYVVRILYAEYKDLCGCSVCCTLETIRCGFYIRGTKIFAFCKRMRPKRIKIWWGIGVENFCVGKRMCGVKNLGRLRAKIFALSMQFNVLQHDA